MGHCIRAFVGKSETVNRLADAWLRESIMLPQDFALLFLSDDFFDDIEELANIKNELNNRLTHFTSAISQVMEEHSINSCLCYIETEYFGGAGGQGGVLYRHGHIEIQPAWEDGIINRILSAMGVVKQDNHDEFDSIHLGWWRKMD